MRSFRLIAVGLVGVALLAGHSALAQPKPEPRSAKAKLLIVWKTPEGNKDSLFPSNRQEFMATQASILTSQSLADEVAKVKEVAALLRFAGKDAVVNVLSAIKATPTMEAGGMVMALEAQGIPAEEGAVLLDGVIRAYQEFSDREGQGQHDGQLEVLNKARMELETKIRDADNAYMEFVTSKSPILLSSNKTLDLTPHNDLRDRVMKHASQRVETAARLSFFTAMVKDSPNSDAIKVRVAEWAKQRNLDKELATIGAYLDTLKYEIAESEKIEAALNTKLEAVSKQVQNQKTFQLREESLKAEMERAKALQRLVMGRMESLDLSRARGGWQVNVLSKPH